MSVILFINPLYLHLIVEKTVWMTGVLLFIIPLLVVIASPIIGHINHHVGCRPILIVGSIFYLLTGIAQLFFTIDINYLLLVPTFILFGIAWAIVNQVPAVALGQSIESDHVSVAMGALFSFFNIGAAVMLAVSVSLFHWRATQKLFMGFMQQHISITALQKSLLEQFVSQPDQMQQVLKHMPITHPAMEILFKEAFMAGMHIMFWPLIIASAIALWAVVFVMKKQSV